MTQTAATPIKGLEPGDLVTRGTGSTQWVVNFIHPTNPGQVTLVREGQKARSGSTRWWDEAELHLARKAGA